MSTAELTESRSRSVDTLAGNENYLVSEKGDVSRPKSAGIKKTTKPEERSQKEEIKRELLDVSSPFRTVSERTALMDLNGLLHITPEPLPPLKNMVICKLNFILHSYRSHWFMFDFAAQGQVSIIADQVNRMKKDIAKLQQIAEEYKCMEKYKADIDFLVENVKDAISE